MNWFKKSQYTEENTQNVGGPSVVVQPYEPLVQQVVDEMSSQNPGIFNSVNKINIDMGYGQFGSVVSDNPADININVYNLKSSLSNQLGISFDANNPQHTEAMKDQIRRVILHEMAHVSDYDEEQHMQGDNPFPGGEGVAEQAERDAGYQ